MKPTSILAALLVVTSGTAPASAQIPGLGDAARVLDRVPSLSSFLEGDPPITTSLDDARTEIAFLDAWSPGGWQRLDALPRSSGGGFRLRPGRFAMESQSYCMHAGTHGPGGGDGYLRAPLAGSKADIVRSLLRNSVAHPEVRQQDIQSLIWAIIARTEFDEMPSTMQRTARTLLSRDEVDELDDGALGMVPESVMREAMRQLPPVARQVFEAEARLRSAISSGSSSFAELERIAVLTGAAEPPEGSRPVPEGRWSFDPDGYFVRYAPSSYSRTRVEVSVPAAVAFARDPEGRIVGLYGRSGRLESGPGGVLFARSPADPGRSVLASLPVPAGDGRSSAAQVLAHVLGSERPPASALGDLAQLEALARALGASGVSLGDGRLTPGGGGTGPDESRAELMADAGDLVVEAWQATFCAAVGCPGFGAAGDVLVLRNGGAVRGDLRWCYAGNCLLSGAPFAVAEIEWIGLARPNASPPQAGNPQGGEVHRVDGAVRPGDLTSLGDDLVLTNAGGHARPDVAWIHLSGVPVEEAAPDPVGGGPADRPADPQGPGDEEEEERQEGDDDEGDSGDEEFDGPLYDPSDDVATPGNRGRQRLAQSSRTAEGGPPAEDEDDCADERRNFEQANALWDRHFAIQQDLYQQVVDELGLETIAEMEGYAGPGESLVHEYLEMEVEGQELYRRANEAQDVLLECEGSDSCATERRAFEEANAAWDRHFAIEQELYQRVVDEVGLETLAEMEGYAGPGESLVHEYLEIQRAGQELNRRAVEAQNALEECEAAAG